MAATYDCSDETQLLTGMRLARQAIGSGELVVIPTDTVYGIAADAFDPAAVKRLVAAKGRTAPPPVLIPGPETLPALAEHVPDAVYALVEKFWPGGLTVIVAARESLTWDLGETHGTVALRQPSHPIALELLRETGPLAVSSANLTGQPPATTVDAAVGMLGESISVYLDAGPAGVGYEHGDRDPASTIVDATGLDREGGLLRVLRRGVLSDDDLREVVGDLLAPS